jgi:hypothetical protein
MDMREDQLIFLELAPAIYSLALSSARPAQDNDTNTMTAMTKG